MVFQFHVCAILLEGLENELRKPDILSLIKFQLVRRKMRKPVKLYSIFFIEMSNNFQC